MDDEEYTFTIERTSRYRVTVSASDEITAQDRAEKLAEASVDPEAAETVLLDSTYTRIEGIIRPW